MVESFDIDIVIGTYPRSMASSVVSGALRGASISPATDLETPFCEEGLVALVGYYCELGLVLGHPLGEVRHLRVEDPYHDRVIRELVPPLHYPVDPDVAEGARGEPEEGQDDPPALHGGHLEGGAVDGWQ